MAIALCIATFSAVKTFSIAETIDFITSSFFLLAGSFLLLRSVELPPIKPENIQQFSSIVDRP